jgi:hypothetical protein
MTDVTCAVGDGARGALRHSSTDRHQSDRCEESAVIQTVHVLLAAPLPNPEPAAPADLSDKVNTVLGLIKWASLITGVAALMGFGFLVWAADHGGYGSQGAEMKERFGKVILGLVVTMSATSIVSFIIS